LQEGWGPDGVQTVALGGIDSAISALRAHEVDAVVLGTEAGYKLEEAQQGRIITDMARYAPHFITHVVFAQPALEKLQDSLKKSASRRSHEAEPAEEKKKPARRSRKLKAEVA